MCTLILSLISAPQPLLANHVQTPKPGASHLEKPEAKPQHGEKHHRRIRAVKVTAQQDLDFGKIANMGGGRVRLGPNGHRRFFGNVVDLGGAHGPARADIRGEPHRPFLIYAPAITKLHRNGGGRLFVRNIISKPVRIGRFDNKGEAKVSFGGDLHVRPRARQGRYRGSVSFWVVYL